PGAWSAASGAGRACVPAACHLARSRLTPIPFACNPLRQRTGLRTSVPARVRRRQQSAVVLFGPARRPHPGWATRFTQRTALGCVGRALLRNAAKRRRLTEGPQGGKMGALARPFPLSVVVVMTMHIPEMAPLRQTAPQPVVADVAAEVRRQWLGSRFAGRVRRGDRVAVGVGSRGIANLATIVRATLDSLRDLGARPFVVAAMGSHGGATPEGQRQLLGEYGVSEQALGVPVKTDMEGVRI